MFSCFQLAAPALNIQGIGGKNLGVIILKKTATTKGISRNASTAARSS